MTTPTEASLSERLRHAVTTMTNDDQSEIGTDKRFRFACRCDAMLEAASALDAKDAEIAVRGERIIAAWNAFGGPQFGNYEQTIDAVLLADGDLDEQIAELTKQRDRAEARIARLEAALVPLVAFLGAYPRPRIAVSAENTIIVSSNDVHLTLAHLKDAIAALQTESEVNEGDGAEPSTLAAEAGTTPSVSCRGKPSPAREWLVIENSHKNSVFASDDAKKPAGYIPRDTAEKVLGRSLNGIIWFSKEDSVKLREHPEWRETEPPEAPAESAGVDGLKAHLIKQSGNPDFPMTTTERALYSLISLPHAAQSACTEAERETVIQNVRAAMDAAVIAASRLPSPPAEDRGR